MYELNSEYLEALENIAADIQDSDLLAQYLEEEEEELYLQLKTIYEPRIGEVYNQVANDHPLQLISLEAVLLDPAFEGLFLPRLLGYNVLRGELDQQYKYVRPQEQFREVLDTICGSANFDILKKRIGQSIQMGFALSSDIWVTNFLDTIENKRIRQYMQSHRQDRFRYVQEREGAYQRYRRQFQDENFLTAELPTTVSELKVYFSSLKHFLLHRVARQYDNSSLVPAMDSLVANEALQNEPEYLQLLLIYGAFFDLPDESLAQLRTALAQARTSMPEFSEKVFTLMLELHRHPDLNYDAAPDRRLSALLDKEVADELSSYFTLTDNIHQNSYTTGAVQEAIKQEYDRHEGLSLFNENLRYTVLNYFHKLVTNLEESDYTEYFEISKLFAVYIRLFGNQQFNQHLKEMSLQYVRKLLKRYTDKRGRDYQDIKKFVATTFLDFDFLTEKEIVEMFKTRRKKRKQAE